MKDFVRPKGRLANLPTTARVVYSVFLAFTLAGLALTVWLTDEMVRLDLSDMDSYYAGIEEPRDSVPSASSPPLTGGPALELPEDLDEEIPTAEPMPTRKLLEVTHFHLFSMPVYLVILAHLFMLSRRTEPAKLFWIGLATISVAAHMLAPWLARGGGETSHLFFAASGTGLGASFLVMSVIPLWEMWVSPASSRRKPARPKDRPE